MILAQIVAGSQPQADQSVSVIDLALAGGPLMIPIVHPSPEGETSHARHRHRLGRAHRGRQVRRLDRQHPGH